MRPIRDEIMAMPLVLTRPVPRGIYALWQCCRRLTWRSTGRASIARPSASSARAG